MVGYFVGRRAKSSHGKLTHLVHEESGWSAYGTVKEGPWERLLPGLLISAYPTCRTCLRAQWRFEAAERKAA
jgi:hypothetical protein